MRRGPQILLLVFLLVLVWSTQTQAQTRKKPHNMEEKELKEAGFQWEPEADHKASLVGGVIGALPGSIVHGMGHYYVGNSQAGKDLIYQEFVVAIPIMLIGGLLYATADGSSGVQNSLGLGVLQVGGALYATNYAADVIGVAKGTHSELPKLSKRLDGMRTRTAYTLLASEGLPCRASRPCHLADLALEADLGSVVLVPYARLDVTGEYEELGLDMEWKTVPGQTPQEYWGLGLSLSQVSFSGLSTDVLQNAEGSANQSVIRFEASINLSLDLNILLAHLQNVLAHTSGGVGFAFDGGDRAALPGDTKQSTYVFLKHALMFNIAPTVMVRPYYVFSEAEPVKPLTDWAGTFGSEVVWTLIRDWDVYIDGVVGDGVAVSSGVRYNFWP